MTRPIFETIDQIPDLIEPGLLLPVERDDLRVPRQAEHSSDTTSPVEIAYCIYELGIGGFAAEKHLLEIMSLGDTRSEEFLTESWGNHLGRAVVRAMLDPARKAPIIMTDVYENELGSARFPAGDEIMFFENFVKEFGVLNRGGKLAA